MDSKAAIFDLNESSLDEIIIQLKDLISKTQGKIEQIEESKKNNA